MQYGISGVPIPIALPYAAPIEAACGSTFPPCLAYAVAYRESIGGELAGLWPSAASVVSGDGGHGLFQITAGTIPEQWADPAVNAKYAVDGWLKPAMVYWGPPGKGFEGDDLARLIAASFNAGIGGAERGHDEGDCDRYTTDHYAANVLRIYQNLVLNGKP